MADQKEINVPDIGGATDVDVIEILVNEGDEIKVDDPLVTLESDKASMDIPSPSAGVVKKIQLNVGDKVSEGDVILTVSNADEGESSEKQNAEKEKDEQNGEKTSGDQHKESESQSEPSSEASSQEIKVPDIGGAEQVDVIEILVKEGDHIDADDSLITLESEKASMEIPAPVSGVIKKIQLKVGDKVSEGDVILSLSSSEETKETKETPPKASTSKAKEEKAESQSKHEQTPSESKSAPPASDGSILAGPAVRKLARELGVDLNQVSGTGQKSRITKEDVEAFVKSKVQGLGSSGLTLPQGEEVDFSKFGETERQPLNKIKKLTGANVHRSWVTIPHVTQFDEADITELETFRKAEAQAAKDKGYKLTLLAFVCKVVAYALKEFPQFNSSLDPKGETLVLKKYFNIGVAVDTPNGLVVPVIKAVNSLSVNEIAKEMGRLSEKARKTGLMPNDMSGGCFTISSLGGIGGTAFTPIVNSPEVAILGLSRATYKPVFRNEVFEPRLTLPVSLSYDHRVIDGAEAARFTRFLCDALSDIRKVIL